SIPGPHFEEIDLFVFPDLGQACEQIDLEERGKRVWGARHGEDLENYRELCKNEMEKRGLPVQPWRKIKGITALRSWLKAHKDQHVKINKWRGLTESFFSPRFEVVETKLDDIEKKLGAFKETLDFIVEDDLPDRIEVGIDSFTIDGEWPNNTLVGIEAKDIGYVGQVRPCDKIPEPICRWNQKMSDFFERQGSRCNVSNEIRIGEDQEPYMIDATIRMPSPPGELWQEMCSNLCEIYWEGANGTLVEPKFRGKWGVEVILKSPFARENHLPVFVPEQFDPFVKLYNSVTIDGCRYVLSQGEDMEEIGSVIGWGGSLDEAVARVQKVGESVEAYGVKFSLGSVDQVRAQIEEMDDIGLSVFDMDKEKEPA